MKTFLTLIFLIIAIHLHAQKGVYDQKGNRLYYVEDSGTKQEVLQSNGSNAVYDVRILFDSSGKAYTFDHKWEQIIRDDRVIMNYNFNRRRWEWVEAAGLTASKFGKKEDIQRIYERDENEYTTPDQGEYPILTFKIVDYVDERGQNSQKGDYIDEFGHTVLSRKGGGSYPSWMNFLMLHNYYQENYTDADFMERITERRNFVADSLASTNSLALAMLELGKDYETNKTTFMGDHFEMTYFTEIEGRIELINEEQITKIKNDWLILNPDTYRRTAPYDMPEAGFYVSKKQAKKKGITGINSKSIVLEVKIKPESISEFKTAISE